MTSTTGGRTAFVVERLIDGTGRDAIEDAVIVVEGSRLLHVGPRPSMTLDPERETIHHIRGTALPGLIDSHSHVFLFGDRSYASAHPVFQVARATQNARRLLDMGVTTTRDLGASHGNLDLYFRECVNAGLVVGPTIFSSGDPIIVTGAQSGPYTKGLEVSGPEQARRAARQQLNEGADHLKIFATAGVGYSRAGAVAAKPAHQRAIPRPTGGKAGWLQMNVEEMRAVVEIAHHVDAVVACHAIGSEGVKNAVRAGVDTIEHGCAADDEGLEMMAAAATPLVPTLSILHTIAYRGAEFQYLPGAIDNARRVYEESLGVVAKAREMGIKIAAGTDSMNGDTIAMECQQLVKAGLTPMEAIVAATKHGAELLRQDATLGTLEAGKSADIVIVEGNPLDDIGRLAEVRHVIKAGTFVFSAEAPRPAPVGP